MHPSNASPVKVQELHPPLPAFLPYAHWAAEHLHAQSIGRSEECHVQIAKPAEWLGLPTAADQGVADLRCSKSLAANP